MVKGSRLEALDGLRGIAALWVLLGHAAILTGFKAPILSEPDLGVDLFIMLSGFLMVYQFELRAEKEPWSEPLTWIKFWIRRVFRIAPLYYLLLIVALAAGPMIYDARMALDLARHANPQAASRYLDGSVQNFLLHATFLYGLIPSYSFRTPLPDWSIALEMQFYAVFPFTMLLLRRTGAIGGGLVIVTIAIGMTLAMRAVGVAFPMPAFLPLKMPIFVCGMMIACMAKAKDRRTTAILMVLTLLYSVLPLSDQQMGKISVRPFIALGFAALIYAPLLPGMLGRLFNAPAGLFASRPLYMLGELSFGAYLIHLLIMQPVGAALLGFGLADMPGVMRFALLAVTTLVPTYALSFLGYRFIERRGQEWGRAVVQRLGRAGSKAAAPT